MANLIKEVTTAGPKATIAAANAAKQIHLAEIRRAAGGDLRLGGVGVAGAPVGVRYKPSASGSTASVFMAATGPLHLVENPIKPHPIGPRRRGVRALGTKYGPRARVQHPGVSRPKQPWRRGAAQAKPVVSRIVQRQYGSAFARGVR